MPRGIRILISLLAITVVLLLSTGVTPSAANSRLIADLSWPNCGESISKLTPSGIVGVNGGLDFRPNPCLPAETQLFHNSYALYLNTGYPGRSYGLRFKDDPRKCQSNNDLCLAYNYGYNAALYSLNYANRQNAHSFVWWLDVETDNSWTTDYNQNRRSLEGMIAAIKGSTLMPTIGFYSYPGQWQQITKSWKNKYPDWLASASVKQSVAIKYCSNTFTAGSTWLAQYTSQLDYNYNCLPNKVDDFKIGLSGK